MALINSDVVPFTGGAYEIEQSLRFNDDDSAYLSWTPSSAGNRKTWTYSVWVKRGNLTSVSLFNAGSNNNAKTQISLGASDLNVYEYNGSWVTRLYSDAKFRDASAWYHIVVHYDTTNATQSDRVKVYVNGDRLTSFQSTVYYPSQNHTSYINNNIGHSIGESVGGSYMDGHLAEVNFIDGQALDPTYFGETGDYGEWKPIRYSGSYGTNGFYLDFDGTYYNDKSGNGNNFTANNLSTYDVVLDSPTNNFATLNPLWNPYEGSYSQGNLYWQPNANHSPSASTIPMESGKYYAEFRAISGSKLSFGVFSNLIKYRKVSGTNYIPGEHTNQDYTGDACVWYYNRIEHNASIQSYPFSSHILVSPNVYMIAFDSDSGKVWFGKEGVWYNNNNQSSTLDVNNPDVTMSVKQGDSFCFHATGENSDWKVNFGQDSSFSGSETAQGNQDGNGYGDFTYTPPSGFLALCTANLPDPAVIPSEHFNTVLYTGTGSSRSVSGVGFQPDFVWFKSRSSADYHALFDAVRGVTCWLSSSRTNAESCNSVYMTSFDSDGFTVGGGVSFNNESPKTYVAWNWKANGSGSSNTNGSITSTVSANQDAGFSIVSYTGNGSNSTVGHGLTQAPEMIITKNRDTGANWGVYNKDIGASNGMYLSLTNASESQPSWWNSTAPTSTVFSIGTDTQANRNGDNFIAYCFHSVDGFSKVGSYTGNGSSDGTFVYTGFKPAFVLLKDVDASNNWNISDSERNPINPSTASDWKRLLPDESVAEQSGATTGYLFDFLSNGFKSRGSGAEANASGRTYIYIAFAEVPFSVGGGIAR